jgi:hypothetical protein
MFNEILKIFNKFIPDEDAAKKAALEMEKQITKRMEMQSDIIKAEQQNGSGKWRVRLMYLCMTMVSLHFIMYEVIPYIRTAFDFDFYTPMPPDSTELWSFLKIGVGGYIGSRGAEKITAHFRGK